MKKEKLPPWEPEVILISVLSHAQLREFVAPDSWKGSRAIAFDILEIEDRKHFDASLMTVGKMVWKEVVKGKVLRSYQ
jgi:hypothetical protein